MSFSDLELKNIFICYIFQLNGYTKEYHWENLKLLSSRAKN
jgi:hypothetical protein